MGLIAWIKRKNYQRRHKKALSLIRQGNRAKAKEKLLPLVRDYAPAVTTLLEVYHAEAVAGSKQALRDTVQLYRTHHELKEKCIALCQAIRDSRVQMAYGEALFTAGLSELGDTVVNTAHRYVCSSTSVVDIQTLLTNDILLQRLVSQLYATFQDRYRQGDIAAAMTIANSCLHVAKGNTQKDLSHRVAVYHLSRNDLTAAEKINDTYLHDRQLTTLCSDLRLQREEQAQVARLVAVNEQLRLLAAGTLAPADALALARGLTTLLSRVRGITSISPEKKSEMQRALIQYAIRKFYDGDDYISCYRTMRTLDESVFNNPIALRPLATMALLAAESDQLSDDNYQECIAVCVTAIYQQEIFVNSLDDTSWDDTYTFTLYDALGVLSDTTALPENVVTDDITGNNIVAIRDVQKELLGRLERALQQHDAYYHFYSQQVGAMDLLAEQNLDEPCCIVAPYLLQLSTTCTSAIHHALLTEEREHYGNYEDILHIGTLYGITSGAFATYATAQQYLAQANDYLATKRNARSAFAKTHIAVMRRFEKLFTTLVAAVTTAFNNDIAVSTTYETIYHDYYPVFASLGDDNFSFTFANYINKQVTPACNDDKISESKCADILFSLYTIYNSDSQIKNNLASLVSVLVVQYLNNAAATTLTTLDTILSATRDFDQSVIDALTGAGKVPEEMVIIATIIPHEQAFTTLQQRIGSHSTRLSRQFRSTANKINDIKLNMQISDIVDKVNNETLPRAQALKQLYDIYVNHKDNNRVCENLATLVPMCIMEYVINDRYGSQAVQSVLDKLKNNMSSTFRSNRAPIGEAYNVIWNQLPYDARRAIDNESWSLNEQGLAMKRGIEYLRALK